ncbi:YihY/virulence factor BrkB family protein [Flavobacteriaceae bacterium]|nr:YihY/virulence factor BrkB family protein [Flavobacteriaceae bacterium]|tara:strand:+ start:1359 stop:2252 length:894 start_codon:yes stop_codon:yes gene_type:complete
MSLLKTNFIISTINYITNFLKTIKWEILYGFSLYELLNLYFTGILKGSITTRAGSISFSFFMAFFPFLLFVLNLIPFIPIDNFDQIFLDLLESLIPKESSAFFHDIFIDINSNKRSGLLSTTLFFSIILIGSGVNSVFAGFSDSYHIEFSRNFIKQYLYAIMVGFILVVVVLFATVFSIAFDFLIARDISIISYLFLFLKYVFLMIVALIAFSSLYFFGTIQGRNLRFISPGSFMTTFLLVISTYFFGIYIDNFANYNELYGSIGALIIMMLYIWINSISLLLGFELNVVIYKLKNN